MSLELAFKAVISVLREQNKIFKVLALCHDTKVYGMNFCVNTSRM
jgi:hypothetical protein